MWLIEVHTEMYTEVQLVDAAKTLLSTEVVSSSKAESFSPRHVAGRGMLSQGRPLPMEMVQFSLEKPGAFLSG